jgi:ubiquitin-protein ligase
MIDLDLLNLNNKILTSRIKRELKNLIEEQICNQDSISILNDNEDVIIEIIRLENNKSYKFTVSKNYPFHPPKLKINNEYLTYNTIQSELFKIILKEYIGIKCFCCESILCKNNWSPALTLKHVLLDSDKIKTATTKVINIIMVNVIKRKYFFDDIPIIEWLYI